MFKKRRKLKIALLLFVVLTIVCVLFANNYVKKHGYRNLWDFIITYSSNKSLASDAKFETLEIKIDEADFKKLENEREKALKRGILVKEDDTYVNAKLKHNGKKIKAQLRLKGHMTDHLQDKKWSFRIKTKGGDAFMGMKIFSIQHPGTRNYIYEWIYHQMMKEEGVIALRYDFIKVKVNGEDWGIYAIEEHFAQELIQQNKRPPGPILRFNPDMYWALRIAEAKRETVDMESASQQSSNIEAYDSKNVYTDSVLFNTYQAGVNLMERFRQGELKTHEVFDIEKLARFHAIIDVIGGHQSLDWSDVKYYYNSVEHKIEPVAYESFSIQPTMAICGSFRYSDPKEEITDFHTALFSDPIFFEKYIVELKRIASQKWLNQFFKNNKKELDKKLAIIFTEYAFEKFNVEEYFKNIHAISKILRPLKGIHAYLDRVNKDTVFIGVAGIDALPFKITDFVINEKKIPLNSVYIPSKLRNKPVKYQLIIVKAPLIAQNKISPDLKLKLLYELPGSGSKMEAIVDPANLSRNLNESEPEFTYLSSDLKKFECISVNEKAHLITFKKGYNMVDHTLVIGPGYNVIMNENTVIDLRLGAGIVSYSPMFITGNEENPVKLISQDKTGKGVVIINSKKQSVITNTIFVELGDRKNRNGNAAAILTYDTDIKINNCIFSSNATNDVCCFRGKLKIQNSIFESSVSNSIFVNYNEFLIEGINIANCLGNAVKAVGSTGWIRNSDLNQIGAVAFLAKSKTEMNITHVKIKKADKGFEAVDGSTINSACCEIYECNTALKASKKGNVFGPSQINVKQFIQEKNKWIQQAEKGSVINLK